MADDVLNEKALAIGEAWAREYARALRAQSREPIGAWPGTMSEARMRMRASVNILLDARRLDDLARVANLAARRGWQEVSEPDPEP